MSDLLLRLEDGDWQTSTDRRTWTDLRTHTLGDPLEVAITGSSPDHFNVDVASGCEAATISLTTPPSSNSLAFPFTWLTSAGVVVGVTAQCGTAAAQTGYIKVKKSG